MSELDPIAQRLKNLADAGVRKRTWKDYAGRLFNNVYNYTLLGGLATASALTGDWYLLVAGLGIEALFMLYAPDSKFMRKRIDAQIDREEALAAEEKRFALLSRLESYDRQRCRDLLSKQAEISKLAKENPSFGSELLQQEITKLQRLTDSFIDLSITATRYKDYLDREDIGDIEKQKRRYEQEIEHGKGPAVDLAKKNLDVVLRRLVRLGEINDFVVRARRQLELIENSFGLLADQIVSMRSPQELAGQLDELIDGVEAVRETAREADKLMQGVALGA